MPDVIDQLRAYGDAVEQAVPAAAAPTPPRHHRPLLAPAAVLAVVVCAAAAVWVLRSRDESAPPVDEGVELMPGWHALAPGPLTPREGSALVWTGDELVVWGGVGRADGAAYDPSAGTWRRMGPAPISDGPASGVWTGEEVLVWSGRVGAAWSPDTDGWRPLAEAPDPVRGPVWTGDEVIDLAVGAYDPDTDAWRRLGQRVGGPEIERALWTGDHVVVLHAGRVASYEPATDTWDSHVPPIGNIGVDVAWNGQYVVALDYEMRAARWRPGDERWEPLPPLPLRFSECSPTLARIGDAVLASHCWGYGLLTPEGAWAIGPPPAQPAFLLVSAGDRVFSGSSLAFTAPDLGEDLAAERTIPVGTVLLDLPADAHLVATDVVDEAGGLVTRLRYELDGVPCRLESTSAGTVGQSAARIRNDVSRVEAELGHIRLTGVDVDRDRALVARIEPGQLDDQAHVLLEESASDVLDIICDDLATAEDLLSRIHR